MRRPNYTFTAADSSAGGTRVHARRDPPIIGTRFGRLVVIERAHVAGKNSKWLCRCDCGQTKVIQRGNLTGGLVRSCGCLRRDMNQEKRETAPMRAAARRSAWGSAFLALTGEAPAAPDVGRRRVIQSLDP